MRFVTVLAAIEKRNDNNKSGRYFGENWSAPPGGVSTEQEGGGAWIERRGGLELIGVSCCVSILVR
jgi:hypothetical protein